MQSPIRNVQENSTKYLKLGNLSKISPAVKAPIIDPTALGIMTILMILIFVW